jgi:putative membrane protein
MRFVGKILVTALSAIIAAKLLPGVAIDKGTTAILVALVLGLLNTFVKPLLVFLTIPFTLLTLGLFLLVINMLIVKWTSDIVHGFRIDNWWAALWFSILLTLVTSVIESLIRRSQGENAK